MTIEQDYIDQLVVTPTGIDIVHVEFDVIRRPSLTGSRITEVDVATTVYHLNMRIKKGDILIIYNVSVCKLTPIIVIYAASKSMNSN